MPAETDTPQLESGDKSEREIDLRISPSHVTIYSNSAAIGMSFFDFRLAFGETHPESTPQKVVINNSATVIMTPEHAKRLANVLGKNVQQYEERFGKIREMPE